MKEMDVIVWEVSAVNFIFLWKLFNLERTKGMSLYFKSTKVSST